MKILDEIKIEITAGHGGPGHCSFLRTMTTKFGGPNGGDGGKGGDVFIRGNSNINHLGKFRWKKIFAAEDGERGRNKSQHGSGGRDLILDVPLGTQILSQDLELITDITQENQIFKIAIGGKKGRGNEFFKSSVNRAPTRTSPGLPGENKEIILSLKMLADVGIIGLPNAGKSSFIRQITNSKAEIGNYQFTTLSPNLGVCTLFDKSIILADLPGIIENASQGKGLGIHFLKHVDRCTVLLHFVDIDQNNLSDKINIILNEIKQFNAHILNKPIFLCFTKIDKMENIQQIKQEYPKAYFISNFDKESYQNLLNDIFNYFEPKEYDKIPPTIIKNAILF